MRVLSQLQAITCLSDYRAEGAYQRPEKWVGRFRVMSIGVLRELMRHLQAWQALYESDNLDSITGPDGETYHLADIQYLYGCRILLSPRQRQAIELCLYENVKERDATEVMGVSPTNPVCMYSTNGLAALIRMIDEGKLPRYRPEHLAVVA